MYRCTIRSVVVALASATIALAPSIVRAQDGPRTRRVSVDTDPDYWVGLSLGYVDGVTLTDAKTGNIWQFGYSTQIQATVEKKIQRGVTFGVSAGYSTAPLIYTANNSFDAGCFGCAAKADITQYLAFIRGNLGGKTLGFHGLYSFEAGLTNFSNFRENDTGDMIIGSSSANDFTFGLIGGAGYGISSTAEVYASYGADLVLHSQGSNTVTTSVPRMGAFRGGFRIGF